MASGRRPSGAAPGSEDTWPPAPTRGTQGASRNGRGPAENPETGGPHRGGRPEHRSACWDIVRPEDKAHNKDRNVVASDPPGGRAGQGKAAGGADASVSGRGAAPSNFSPPASPALPRGPGSGPGAEGTHLKPRGPLVTSVPFGSNGASIALQREGRACWGLCLRHTDPLTPLTGRPRPRPPVHAALRGLPHERPSPGLSQPPASGQEASAVLLPTTATPLRLHPAPGCHRGWGVGWEWAVPSGVRVWSNPGTTPPPESAAASTPRPPAPSVQLRHPETGCMRSRGGGRQPARGGLMCRRLEQPLKGGRPAGPRPLSRLHRPAAPGLLSAGAETGPAAGPACPVVTVAVPGGHAQMRGLELGGEHSAAHEGGFRGWQWAGRAPVKPGHLAAYSRWPCLEQDAPNSRATDDREAVWRSLPRLVSRPWENERPRGRPRRTLPRPRSALPKRVPAVT